MKPYQEGEKLKAMCEGCRDLVQATFAYRDVPFENGPGIVKNVLAAVCDECDRVVALPAQATPAVRRALRKAQIPLEVTLTAREMDVLDTATYRIDPQASSRLRKTLIAFFLRRNSLDPEGAARLKDRCTDAPRQKVNGKAPPKMRLSLKLAPRTDENLKALTQSLGLRKSQIVRGVIREIEEELVAPDNPAGLERFREIADVLTA